MRKTITFKGGFEIGEKENFFAYQLLVVTDKIDMEQVDRLAQAVDKEYKKILAEQCGIREGGLDRWLGKISK